MDCPRLDQATLEKLLVAIIQAKDHTGRLVRIPPELVLRQSVLDQLPAIPMRGSLPLREGEAG